MKKKGTILIEAIISCMLLVIILSVYYKLISKSEIEQQRRVYEEEVNRIIFCVMEEIKYNYTINEIKDARMYGNIDRDYYKEFLNDLSKKDLLSLPIGNEIQISYTEKSTKELVVKIKAIIVIDEIQIIKERTFIKSQWMEHVNEI